MASRAVVFRPINADDVSCTPFEANTTFKANEADYLANHYVLRHGVYTNQVTPISSSLSGDNAKNVDGTFQTVHWKAIDHMFYRPEHKNEPMHTYEHYNPRYTEKNLFLSCSTIIVPYVSHGENIKRESVILKATGSLGFDRFILHDDKYGNLRDRLIDSSSFAPKTNLIGYWGFEDAFRHLELLDQRGTKTISNRLNNRLRNIDIKTVAHQIKYTRGIDTTQYVTASGVAAMFNTGSLRFDEQRSKPFPAYIITDNYEKVNFTQDDDFAISFWCYLPPNQASETISEKHDKNAIITKCGVVNEIKRRDKKGRVKGGRPRTTYIAKENRLHTRFPFDIRVSNSQYKDRFGNSGTAGKLVFRRSDGIEIQECTSSVAVTGSWNHIVCQKSSSVLQIYLNGTEVGSRPDMFHGKKNNLQNPCHLMFGAVDFSGSNQLSGSLDEIRIYNKHLTSAQISSLGNNNYYSSSAYQTSVVGNVFYRTGQINVSSPLPKYHYALHNEFDLEHKSSRTIYENEVLVKVPAGECNVSMNPTLRKPNSELIQNQFTGSAWKPYITTVGLYDDQARLLAVAKLARPIQKREDIDMNFLIRWDY
tara:strand:+ start:19386 stop:21158 length:1773 start_codon:yes stop_codon:yes gene_type:complete